MPSEHSSGHAQFLVGTFVLTKGHSSTAVVTAGIFGESEHFGQPTAGNSAFRIVFRTREKKMIIFVGAG